MTLQRSAPRIFIAATITAVACTLTALPLVAFGDDTAPSTAPSAEVAELLEVGEQVAEINADAVDQAPPAVGSSCNATLDVEGIGDACVARDGLLRVEQADGRSHTIHGLDAPPVGASSYAPTSMAAVNGAGVGSISCAAAGTPQYVLVYARPGNVASRYGSVAPLLQSESYKVSAFIDSESRSVDPTAGRRLPMRCDAGGAPVVLDATLSGLTAGTASFASIVDGLRSLGYQFNGDKGGTERYMVYWDAPSPSGAAGTGHVFTTDASGGPGNQNNKGGLYSVEYRFDQGGGVPHWEVMVHEVLHTMGAVVGAAPHSTPAGHCTDGLDVMCYQDANGSAYTSTTCATKVLDCNRDDYFNPAPPAGSYLATHWNAAASYNAWLVGHAASSPAVSQVGGLLQTGASASSLGLAWSPAAGAASYVVTAREPGGTWRQVAQTTRSTASIGGLRPATTYDVGVASVDSAGRVGAAAEVAMTTGTDADTQAPGRPGRIVVRQRAGSALFRWTAPADDIGVARFELRVVTRSLRGRSVRRAGTTSDTTFTMPTARLRPGALYEFELVAFDAAGNASAGRAVRMRVMRDRLRPTPVRALRATSTRSSVTLRWAASRDNVGVSSYVVQQRVGRRWVQLGTTTAARRAIGVQRLRSGSTYQFRVQARDAANNRSAPTAIRARTR